LGIIRSRRVPWRRAGFAGAASARAAAVGFDVLRQAREVVVLAASALLDAVQLWC
jgi:hypothetical protein